METKIQFHKDLKIKMKGCTGVSNFVISMSHAFKNVQYTSDLKMKLILEKVVILGLLNH